MIGNNRDLSNPRCYYQYLETTKEQLHSMEWSVIAVFSLFCKFLGFVKKSAENLAVCDNFVTHTHTHTSLSNLLLVYVRIYAHIVYSSFCRKTIEGRKILLSAQCAIVSIVTIAISPISNLLLANSALFAASLGKAFAKCPLLGMRYAFSKATVCYSDMI